MTRHAATRSERGSTSVELAIVAPLVGVLLAGVVLAGRVQSARADLEATARAAARDLSIARDPHAAVAAVKADAALSVEAGSPTCRSMTFTPIIFSDRVTVTISCAVDLAAAAVLPVPGSLTLDASATEIVDTYRERAQR